MIVVGCDFGASSKAGLQARKTVLIEAERVASRHYRCHETGRNRRLLEHNWDSVKKGVTSWKANRAGWTITDLADSLATDQSISAAAFDFPFSIPLELLESVEFAAAVNQEAFRTRDNWVRFLMQHLSLRFDSTKASATLTCLRKVDSWKRKTFWIKRATDDEARAQPPLKHLYQNVYNMTLLGSLLLAELEAGGLEIILTENQLRFNNRSCVEAYPAVVAKRIGVTKRYKQHPVDCVQKAIDWLASQNITLHLPDSLKQACATYRTAENDYDVADALMCLVTAICVSEGLAEMLVGTADRAVQQQEGGIVVPHDDDSRLHSTTNNRVLL